ncbi:hypothetical protein [Nitrosomonas europaea]|uniref:hypothetical protein n=1 Tax=Nitrosomonas europaea TaxID=915 RepID=UPI00079A3F3A|nr:hypothetical protein [Nitrosomonas europaea]KXK49606.1 MAG: peptidyl-tRNA hydrolase [Nitrosomonas europaea]
MLNQLGIKPDGSDAGHRGVRSCLVALGTDQIKRLRLGVGLSGKTGGAKKRVLTNFFSARTAATTADCGRCCSNTG